MSFTKKQRAALRALARLWRDRRFVLVGASALGCQMRMAWRGTSDLDIAIAVEMDEYPAGLQNASGWKRDPRLEQRWYYREVPVDVLPAGERMRASGGFTWPESELEMSLAAMDLAFAQCSAVPCGGGATIDVASVPAIATLKMASFCDRPFERERDLEDLGHVLERYLDDDDRRFDETVFNAGVTFEHVSAFLCGQDIGGLLATPEHALVVERFLERVSEGETDFFRWLRHGPLHDEDELAKRLAAFRLGLQVRIEDG